MAILDDILSQLPQGAETSPWARQMLARMTSGDLVANPNDTPTPSPTPMRQPQSPPAYPSPTAPKLADQTPVPSPRMAMANGLPPIPDQATGVQTFQAGLAGFRNGGLLGGIAGAMGADDVVRERADTFRTLTANGIAPPMAALLVRNPELFKSAFGLQQYQKTENDKNQTADFLVRKYGMDPAQARAVAQTPELLTDYLDPLGQRLKTAKVGQVESQSAISAAQLQQLKMQTPQYRASVAASFGLTQGTPEYNSFVLNGTYTPKDETIHLKDGEQIYTRGRDAQGGITYNKVGGNEKTPSGYRPTQQGNLEAIPGGPADIKMSEKRQQDFASMQSMFQQLDELAKSANAVKTSPGLAGNFGLRGVVPNVPGSSAANAWAQLETLRTQAAFAALQEMRNASKSGGALGAVSDKENAMLQAALAPLQKAQSYEQAKESIDKILAHIETAKARIAAAYNDHWNNGGAAAKQTQSTPRSPSDVLGEARAAITSGAPRDKVIERLRQMGISPEGL